MSDFPDTLPDNNFTVSKQGNMTRFEEAVSNRLSVWNDLKHYVVSIFFASVIDGFYTTMTFRRSAEQCVQDGHYNQGQQCRRNQPTDNAPSHR